MKITVENRLHTGVGGEIRTWTFPPTRAHLALALDAADYIRISACGEYGGIGGGTTGAYLYQNEDAEPLLVVDEDDAAALLPEDGDLSMEEIRAWEGPAWDGSNWQEMVASRGRSWLGADEEDTEEFEWGTVTYQTEADSGDGYRFPADIETKDGWVTLWGRDMGGAWPVDQDIIPEDVMDDVWHTDSSSMESKIWELVETYTHDGSDTAAVFCRKEGLRLLRDILKEEEWQG